jgi:S-adenosylmethionine uptake transporter
MGVLVKLSTGDLPFLVAVFFRNVVALFPLLLYALASGLPLGSGRHGLLFLRSLTGFTAVFLYFLALEYLPLSTAVLLNFSSPVFVVLLSGLILGERNLRGLLPLVLAAFVGVGLLVGPDFDETGVQGILGLASAVFAALAYLLVRRLSDTEPSMRTVTYFAIWSSLFSLIMLGGALVLGIGELSLDRIATVILSPKKAAILIGVGLTGTLGQVFMTSAYARERASVVSTLSYINPLLSFIYGVTLFNDPLTWTSVGGGLLVIGSSVGVVLLAETSPAPGREIGGR